MDRVKIAQELLVMAKELMSDKDVKVKKLNKKEIQVLVGGKVKYSLTKEVGGRNWEVRGLGPKGTVRTYRNQTTALKAVGREEGVKVAATAVRRGLKVGDWVVTQYNQLSFDDLGSPSGGVIKLVNQETTDEIVVRHDHALRGAKWWASVHGRRIGEKSPMKAIQNAVRAVGKAKKSRDDDSVIKGNKWEDMPKGWTDESRKQFWESLTGDVKHKVTKCIKEMQGKVDDPGAFCSSLADRVEGKGWRSERESSRTGDAYEIR